ncbi:MULTISPECIES: cytochrome c family protein [unclassified Ruegeria]|uniref:c-type cytochrome n=1 Tax=unclassified Ruegeria TaxID=2625375 RepID=UPI00148777AA|nr:cytochrome c family protein [Ruegeria sp. HKCCD8929]
MFDTMTVTKAAAGLFGAFLALLLAKWAAEALYHVDSHGEASYIIETEGSADEISEAEEVSFDEMMMAADVEKGARVFKKCAACHKLEDGANGTGPYLYGVVGRPVASAAGFGAYSGALQDKGGDWTPEALDAFLAKPSADVPGTSMSFAGLKKAADRVNVIAYLDSLDD